MEDRIWVTDRTGFDEVDVGEQSGEIVSRANVSPAGPVHPEAGMVVALTFDDGPDPRWTPTILQILHDDQAMLARQRVGGLMAKVGAPIAHPLVHPAGRVRTERRATSLQSLA